MKKLKILGTAVLAGIFMSLTLILNVSATGSAITDLDGEKSSDYVKINIDGVYYDWDDKPHTSIHYAWDTHNTNHLGALYRDDKYVYLHIKMSKFSYTRFNGYNYCFTVDGKPTYVVAVPPDGTSIGIGNTPLVIRNQNGYGIIPDASGVLSVGADKADEWELRIPLSFFTSTPETVKTITFYSTNLGPQELVATGTPTLPFIVAGGGLLFAIVGYIKFKKRKIS